MNLDTVLLILAISPKLTDMKFLTGSLVHAFSIQLTEMDILTV